MEESFKFRYYSPEKLSEDDIFCLNAPEALQVAKMLFTASDI